MWPVVLGGAALAAIYASARRRASLDAAEVPDTDDLGVTMDAYGSEWDGVAQLVADSLGWPYSWNMGGPGTPWEDGPLGVDCSGYAQMVLVQLGVLDANATDRSASALAYASDRVEVGQQQPGDLALYNGDKHVMVVCGPPGPDGHSPVAGASGGGPDDHGDNPDARVKLYDSALYWSSGFVCYMRVRA